MTPDLFNTEHTPYGTVYKPIPPADPHVSPAEAPRLSGQCKVILDMLRRGRVSNYQMSKVSIKHTSRVSDLRAAGHDIRVVERNAVTGVNWYALFENGVEVQH